MDSHLRGNDGRGYAAATNFFPLILNLLKDALSRPPH